MKVRRSTFVISLLGVLILSAGAAFGLVLWQRSVHSPRQAGIALAKALEANDQASVRNLATGTDTQFKFMSGMAEWTVAYEKYESGFATQFSGSQQPFLENSQKMVAQMETADQTINGDSATLVAKTSGSLVLKFNKVQGQWKLDLSSLCDDGDAAKQVDELRSLADAYDASRANLEAGKFKTADEARIDLKRQVDEVLVKGYQLQYQGKKISPPTTREIKQPTTLPTA